MNHESSSKNKVYLRSSVCGQCCTDPNMDLTAARQTFYGDIGFWADRTPVHEAASLGRVLQLRQLLDSGAAVNTVTVDNITPLHDACIQGHPQCVRMLLDAGAQVDVRNIHGSTPLCHACAAGSVECVRLLLDHGASVNPSLTALTASPLHEACIRGNPECVKLMISKGALLEAFDIYFGTPLHAACAKAHLDCALLLLNAGTPLSLQQLSRIVLRTVLGTRALQVVTKLDISQRLINYLCYK